MYLGDFAVPKLIIITLINNLNLKKTLLKLVSHIQITNHLNLCMLEENSQWLLIIFKKNIKWGYLSRL